MNYLLTLVRSSDFQVFIKDIRKIVERGNILEKLKCLESFRILEE